MATQQEIDDVITAYRNALEAKEYADSLVLEMQQNENDDYKMVWSTKYPQQTA